MKWSIFEQQKSLLIPKKQLDAIVFMVLLNNERERPRGQRVIGRVACAPSTSDRRSAAHPPKRGWKEAFAFNCGNVRLHEMDWQRRVEP